MDKILQKTEEMTSNMRKHNIAICGIQEHRRVHTEDREHEINQYNDDPVYYLYTVSAWRNQVQAANGGVGIIISKEANKSLIKIKRVTNRILIANFQGNPVLTTIVSYEPCEYEYEIVKNIFYEQLRKTIESVPSHNCLIILSDMNTRMGPEDVQYTYNTTTNNNGNWLKEIMEEYQLLAANSQFQKKKGKLWTWISPHKTKNQIDYIIVRNKWRKSIINCEAYNTFISLGSDHIIVVAKVILSLRATKQKMKIKQKYVWSDLRDQVKLQEKYANDVKEKFNIQSLDEELLSKKYEWLVEAINETAIGCMRQITKPRRKLNSDDPRIIRARNAISNAYKTITGKKGHSNLYK